VGAVVVVAVAESVEGVEAAAEDVAVEGGDGNDAATMTERVRGLSDADDATGVDAELDCVDGAVESGTTALALAPSSLLLLPCFPFLFAHFCLPDDGFEDG